MPDEIGIDDAVSGIEGHGDAAGQRRLRVFGHLPLFGLGVDAQMAARHDPEHIVVVERDVPLHVARPVRAQIFSQAFHRSLGCGLKVAVPAGAAGVVVHGVAHQHHFGDSQLGRADKLLGDAQRALVQPQFNGIGSRSVDQLLYVREPRLLVGLPHAPRRIVRLALARPDCLLPFDEDLVALANRVQLFGRDHVAKD